MVPEYGAKIKYAKPEDSSQPLTKEETISVKQVIVTFLFYQISFDATIMMSLSAIAYKQASTTEERLKRKISFQTIPRQIRTKY